MKGLLKLAAIGGLVMMLKDPERRSQLLGKLKALRKRGSSGPKA